MSYEDELKARTLANLTAALTAVAVLIAAGFVAAPFVWALLHVYRWIL